MYLTNYVFHFVLLNFRLSNSFKFWIQMLTIMFSPQCMWSPSPRNKYSTTLPVWSLNQSQCLVPVTVTWSITPGVSNWWRHHSTIEQITPSEFALQLRHIATSNSQETQDLRNCTIPIQVMVHFVMVGRIMTHLLTDVITWMGNHYLTISSSIIAFTVASDIVIIIIIDWYHTWNRGNTLGALTGNY